VLSRVRELRQARGLSQQGLAERAGLTRQSVNGIEAGRYVPNTGVALRLAQALDCRVEDLFALSEERRDLPVRLAEGSADDAQRAVIAQVRGQMVAHLLDAGRGLSEGFVSADGLLLPASRPDGGWRARLLTPLEGVEGTCLLLGCDPSLSIFSSHVSQAKTQARLTWLRASSHEALSAVGRGEAHLAGSHLEGEKNLIQARRVLGPRGGAVIGYAAWEQGFVVSPGNPKGLRTVEDLARSDVRFINREPGSGCREFLDAALRRAGVPVEAVSGYEEQAQGHLAVARSVASGGADCGIALRAAAEACGMDFVPLTVVRFDLAAPLDLLTHPAVETALDLLQSRRLRQEVGALPGYDVSRMGSVLAELPAAS
jgi:molybdate-binding protein/DNA-binding XRE family transcriptional regulator